MNSEEIFKIAGAILTSVGGAAIIMMALSSWLGKVWANRILEKDKLKYISELENIKVKLQSESVKQQLVFSLYFEGQFKIYNDLWLALSELESEVDKLWESATTANLRSFIRSVQKAKKQIRNSALLIEKEHYDQIMENLKAFEEYRVGKESLISLRNLDSINDGEINALIENNRQRREQILSFTNTMLEKMRIQIGGNGVDLGSNLDYYNKA